MVMPATALLLAIFEFTVYEAEFPAEKPEVVLVTDAMTRYVPSGALAGTARLNV